MRVFCLCVYSFLSCWFPLAVFGGHFVVLGIFWKLFVHLGPPRGSPWRHFGFPLAPLGLRGAIWGTLGSQGELGMTLDPKWTSNSEQMALKYCACIQKMTSRNSAPAAPSAVYPPKVAQEPQLPTSLYSRRGRG